MDKSIVVKQYLGEYQSQIVDLILHIQRNEYNIPITKEDQPDLFKVEQFYQNGVGNFWVAIHGDRVVGTIALLDIGNHQVALRKMFVDENYRGKTYNTAGQLLNTAFMWARDKSIKEIYLGTTLQFVAAHRFYEKHGFTEIAMEQLPPNFPVMAVDKKFYRYVV